MIWARVLKNNYLKITELYQTPTKNLVYLLVSRFYDLGLNWPNKPAHTFSQICSRTKKLFRNNFLIVPAIQKNCSGIKKLFQKKKIVSRFYDLGTMLDRPFVPR